MFRKDNINVYRRWGSGTFLDNLKVYSSPDIKFNGKPCGNEATGDNRRIMIEHSIEINNARQGL